MNQIVKDKMQREILVIKNDTLFCESEKKSTVYSSQEHHFEMIIENNYEFMIRETAETNFEYKQPIPYAVVMNEENKIFVYQRWWSWSNAWESRLHSKIAIWVGGHIEREDEESENILRDSLVREVEEELDIGAEDIHEVFPIWYINSEEDEVSKVHFWIWYIVKVKNSNFALLDWELDNGEFKSYSELTEMIASWEYDVEAWTRMLTPEIQKYI